jgi:hypothetical protein
MQNPSPIIVTVQREATHSTTVQDIFVGAFGLTGLLVLIAAVLGGLLALVLMTWHRRRPAEQDHMPSVSPQVPVGRPSTPVR